MSSKPKIITHISRDHGTNTSDFHFDQNSVRLVSNSPIISQYRLDAYETFRQLPIPDKKQEAWRRTDLKTLKPGRFVLNSDGFNHRLENKTTVFADPKAGFAGSVLVSSHDSKITLDPGIEKMGVIFTDLRTAENQHSDLLEKFLGKVIKPDEGKFAALSAAFASNGMFLYVPKNVILEKPLRSVLTASGSDTAFVSHVLICLDEGASATCFQEYTSTPANEAKFHSGLVEIMLAERASLKFVEIQSWDQGVFNFTHERVQVGKSANLDWVIGALGSRLTKSFVDLDLVGEGATGKVSGFSFTNGHQHLDYDTQQNHRVPHTTSDLLYKVALTDESRSIWQGMIYVAPGAVKADGYQANRNLILSSNARADSIPGLEILADDVRCTHGATVGDLDFEQVYYLMTRGIPRNEAEKMLVEGFFDPIMQRIPFETVRSRFYRAIHNKLKL
ncbi:MAG: Fe-S cluster assembly protein SufD [Chloroflexi bacterium]|nr:Fe-S cluster assembly protein SufD [Chloroflexota bacterium]